MDLNSYVEAISGGYNSPLTTHSMFSMFDNDFSYLNDIPILDNLKVDNLHDNGYPISLDDIDEEEASGKQKSKQL